MDCHVTVTVCHMTKVTWGPWESKRIATVVKCISNREMSENSIKFSLSNSEQRDSWLNSGHWTLDTNTLQVWVDKENLVEFLLDSVYYLYNYYMVCALLFHAHYVTWPCTSWCVTMMCDICHVTLFHTHPCIVSSKKKKKILYLFHYHPLKARREK